MAVLNKQQHQSTDEFVGAERPVAGTYHMAVTKCEAGQSKERGTPGINVEFQVVCDGFGPDGKTRTQDQAGRIISTFMPLMSEKGEKETESCLDNIACFAMAVGLIEPGEAKDTDDIDWDDAIGRECVTRIISEKFTDKGGNERVGSKVAFRGFSELGSSKVAKVPKDATSPGMRALGKAIASDTARKPAAGGGGNAGQTQQAPTAQPPKEKKANPYAGL